MGLNLNVVGKERGPVPFVYDENAVILYALGIGATTEEIDFVYEKNLKVFPTFAVATFMSLFPQINEDLMVNMQSLLHMEQRIVLHRPIPPSGVIYNTMVCSSIYDRGEKGAVMNIDIQGRDGKGVLVFESRVVQLDRSAGNFGGESPPKKERVFPPEGMKPDFQEQYETSGNQHAIYRLSGDKNLLHIDPDFARKSGFDRPILHGLCTFGYAVRAVVHGVCGSDPARFRSLNIRFTNVVYPGETLMTEGWRIKENTYFVQTKTEDGKLVLGNGMAEVV